MKLDVIVATYQRPAMLARALEALLTAPLPDDLHVRVTVVVNDDSEETARVVRTFTCRFPRRCFSIQETRRGKSHALNTGIDATSGDLVGVVDDDEEIDPQWYRVIREAFRDERVDFVGGPCLPRWGASPPPWMPSSWRGVIGFVDDGDRVMVFGEDAPGILMGGNSVIHRRVLERVGRYSPALGPRPERRLFSGEDEDMYRRLLLAGAHGLYLPDLKIYHYVPPERLTKQYYRRWSFWNGVSRSVIDRTLPLPATRVGRVPRFMYGNAGRGLLAALRHLRRNQSNRFAGELAVWHLCGFLYGSYFYRKEAG